ncbi:MAG: cytochrome c family protein [Roseibium sp.]
MPKFSIVIAATAVLALTPSAYAQDGDAEAGAKVFRKCAACHNVDNAKAKVGPSLQGVIGRQPGTVEGFKYSKAMVAFGEGKVWNAELLTEYLARPRDIVKGTRMAFAGLKKDDDIANVIAYISQFSPSE